MVFSTLWESEAVLQNYERISVSDILAIKALGFQNIQFLLPWNSCFEFNFIMLQKFSEFDVDGNI
jgi:hypothetical protein